MNSFTHLFSPFSIKGILIRNRILSTGHDTDLGRHGLPTEELIEYQRARAKGGAGLIIVQVVAVHDSARYTPEVLMGTQDESIPRFRKLFDAIHAEGAAAFVQLFHPGRELLWRKGGLVQTPVAPSVAPTERFRLVPRELTRGLIAEIVDGYGAAARRLAQAGADGVEVVASHGYLPAQFLNPKVNRRDDEYGGSLSNRLRIFRQITASIRTQAPATIIAGLRISGDEFDLNGCGEEETLTACRELKDEYDYFNVIGGTSASASGAVHIAPPMTLSPGYMAAFSGKLRHSIGKPVFVAGRINQPQEAERLLRAGLADMCGMTRAMICDPEMPNKARDGRLDDIRACIACNQACIGHAQLGASISCIQYPESGRELQFGKPYRASSRRKIMVVGGGPGGMKAAAVAAEAGHDVTLFERAKRLGGKTHLAQMLPHRAEFGGIITNLSREMELAKVRVVLGTEMTPALMASESPDAIIIATGARTTLPPLEGEAAITILASDEVVGDRAEVGDRVLIYDWLADWTGVGLAEKLATLGRDVTLAVNGICAAAAIQNYVRDAAIARIFKLEVKTLPFMRLYGVEGRSAYLIHTAAQEPVIIENLDTIVTVYPGTPETALADDARRVCADVQLIGDALSPRTAEEAVYEGMVAARSLR
jgi:2,4-dienoyl-CoA reductase-like NADH-dependent reductase (Old Yellow Enzyme family)